MTQNEFFVGIQYLLEEAKNQGWGLDQIERDSGDAIQEFLEESGYFKED